MAGSLVQLGKVIRTLRESRGWSQEELASEANISSEPIRRAEGATDDNNSSGWYQRTLREVLTALSRKRPLTEQEFTEAFEAAGVRAEVRRGLESTIRQNAGELAGLRERLVAQGQRESESLASEFAQLANPQVVHAQYIIADLCTRHPISQVLAAVTALAATLDATKAAASKDAKLRSDAEHSKPRDIVKPPPGAIAHQVEGATILTPTSPPSSGAVGGKLKPKKHG